MEDLQSQIIHTSVAGSTRRQILSIFCYLISLYLADLRPVVCLGLDSAVRASLHFNRLGLHCLVSTGFDKAVAGRVLRAALQGYEGK